MRASGAQLLSLCWFYSRSALDKLDGKATRLSKELPMSLPRKYRISSITAQPLFILLLSLASYRTFNNMIPLNKRLNIGKYYLFFIYLQVTTSVEARRSKLCIFAFPERYMVGRFSLHFRARVLKRPFLRLNGGVGGVTGKVNAYRSRG